MLYLIETDWLWFVVAALIGAAIGYFRGFGRGWLRWVSIAFFVGLIVWIFGGLPERAGFYLESLLGVVFSYVVGSLFGALLRNAWPDVEATTARSKTVHRVGVYEVHPEEAVAEAPEEVRRVAELKTELDQARNELGAAQRRGEYQRAAELMYVRIPELEKKFKVAKAAEQARRRVADAKPADEARRAQEVKAPREAVRPRREAKVALKVFVNYRRENSAAYAGRIHDRLESEFGRDNLFMDVDAVPLGADFVRILGDEVGRCDVLLALMGPGWCDVRDEDGNRRLDNPTDFIRIEIATALQRNIRVIPILLDGARIPSERQLPEDLVGLVRRNGLNVRHDSFHGDINKLIGALRELR
jgi:hypothetical protein